MSSEVVYFTIWICHPHIYIYEANFSNHFCDRLLYVSQGQGRDERPMRGDKYFFSIDKILFSVEKR